MLETLREHLYLGKTVVYLHSGEVYRFRKYRKLDFCHKRNRNVNKYLILVISIKFLIIKHNHGLISLSQSWSNFSLKKKKMQKLNQTKQSGLTKRTKKMDRIRQIEQLFVQNYGSKIFVECRGCCGCSHVLVAHMTNDSVRVTLIQLKPQKNTMDLELSDWLALVVRFSSIKKKQPIDSGNNSREFIPGIVIWEDSCWNHSRKFGYV